MFIFDTSVFSYGFRHHSLAALYEYELESEVASFISVQTLEEIMFAAEIRGWGMAKRASLANMLAKYALLPIDADTARVCCNLRARARKMGRELSTPDAWIMATAMQYKLTLVAHDRDMLISRDLGIELICKI